MNIPYRFSTFRGRRNRSRFVEAAPSLAPVNAAGTFPADVYAFSSEADWPEQLASLRSFLRFAGRPNHFTVVSDGSHSKQSRITLQRADRCVSVIDASAFAKPDLPDLVQRFAKVHPFGKKLALLMSIPPGKTAIYSDSDILFFPQAGFLKTLAESPMPWFLPDCSPSFDRRLLEPAHARRPFLNAGFLVLNGTLDWNRACEMLSPVVNEPNNFTEQTMVHVTIHEAGGQPLPSDRCVLQYDDQFHFSDRYAKQSDIVLRHYISSIRTKFWHHTGLFS